MSIQRYERTKGGVMRRSAADEWARVDEVEREHRMLIDALRAVQYEHSRGLIELRPGLEAAIADLIGAHPRDGGAA